MNVGTPEIPSLDLSKAIKLKDVLFHYHMNIQWVTAAIKTIKSKNLRQITILSNTRIPISGQVREAVRQEWQDLDHVLVQLWISHSVRPVLMYQGEPEADNSRAIAQNLLPELTRRGIINVSAVVDNRNGNEAVIAAAEG